MKNIRMSIVAVICCPIITSGCGKKSHARDSLDESIAETQGGAPEPCAAHDIIVSEEVLIRDYVGSIDVAISRYGKPDSIIPSTFYGTVFSGAHEASVVLNYEKLNSRMYAKRNGDIIAILAIHRSGHEKTEDEPSPSDSRAAPHQPPEDPPTATPGSAPQ